MPIYHVFSNRNRSRRDRLAYDVLSQQLRLHCRRVLDEALGQYFDARRSVDDILEREHPASALVQRHRKARDTGRVGPSLFEVFIADGDFDEAMDAIDVGGWAVNVLMREERAAGRSHSAALDPDEAIEELNGRLGQHGVGYQFALQENHIVRVDSEFLHDEITQPAMLLLTEKGFEGAAQEFAEAHQAYRESLSKPERGKDAVSWAVKAVESTAKAILDQRGWAYEKGDTIKRLLEKLFENSLVPAELESYFGGLRSALSSGLPAIGNSMARHGQGAKVKDIEQHIVTLAMHLTAATIRFLVEAHKAGS